MKEYGYLIASIICLGTVSMVGCSKNVNSIEEKSEMTMDDEINIEENSITDQGDIQETITENLTVNTKIEIPGKSFATYNTEYKNFDNEKIVELLWPESSEEEILLEEGCLSLPGIHEKVSRAKRIRVQYLDENFEEHDEVVEGFAARVVQHECEHLEGHVFIDNISAIRRQLNKGKLNSIIKGTARCSYRAKAVSK